MKLFANNPCFLYPESNFEEELLKSNLLKTKLVYKYIKQIKNSNYVKIDFNPKKQIIFDLKNNYFNFNFRDYKKISYFLRIIIDSYMVKESNLPLHSAFLKHNKMGIFLFADMNGGKSSTLNSLNSKKKIKLIGDDHIIVGEKNISGNLLSRIRNSETEQYLPMLGNSLRTNENIIINLKPSNKNSIKKIRKSKYLHDKKSLDAVLKYLYRDPVINETKYYLDEIIGNEILKKYFVIFEEFIYASLELIEIEGKYTFIQEKVKEVILK